MSITSIKDLYRYIKRNSGFSGHTVHSVIISLGFQLHQSENYFKKLSCMLKDCSKYGAEFKFPGFKSYYDTCKFFQKHRSDIVSHMENFAEEIGTDIITMVQNFNIFKAYIVKPTISEIGKALWDSGHYWPELERFYNVFAWYTLEETSHTWNRYLEDHPEMDRKLSA